MPGCPRRLSPGISNLRTEWKCSDLISACRTRAMGNGLFELRLMGGDGIARVFYCTLTGQRIVMLHCFVKKTGKTPKGELALALRRKQEVCHGKS